MAVEEILNTALRTILSLFPGVPSHVSIEIPEDLQQPGEMGRGTHRPSWAHHRHLTSVLRIRHWSIRRRPLKFTCHIRAGSPGKQAGIPGHSPTGHSRFRSARSRERDRDASQPTPPARRRVCAEGVVDRSLAETTGIAGRPPSQRVRSPFPSPVCEHARSCAASSLSYKRSRMSPSDDGYLDTEVSVSPPPSTSGATDVGDKPIVTIAMLRALTRDVLNTYGGPK